MMKAGMSVNAARKITMLICAIAVLPVCLAQSIDNLWLAVLVIGIATAAHQAFSANLYTLPSYMFPRAAVGSVVGIGGTAGAVGGDAGGQICRLYSGRHRQLHPLVPGRGGRLFHGVAGGPPLVSAPRPGEHPERLMNPYPRGRMRVPTGGPAIWNMAPIRVGLRRKITLFGGHDTPPA
jgi:hypothetical protein